MKNKNFYIDANSLRIESSEGSIANKKFYFGTTTISLSLGILFAFIFFKIYDSPSEKQLKYQIEEYHIKYQISQKQISKINSLINSITDKDVNTYRIIFEMPPLSEDKRDAGIGGSDNYSSFKISDNTKIITETHNKIDLTLRQMNIQNISFDEIKIVAIEKEKMLTSIPSIMPVSKEKIGISSFFGWRRNPFNRSTFSFHAGVDFSGRIGTPIYATGDGVIHSDTDRKHGYGIICTINHGFGYQTVYGHLRKLAVKPGDTVKRGQIIGYLGNTGRTTGPHLHYEVIKNGKHVNPMNYIVSSLDKKEYYAIINQAQEEIN